MKLPINTAYTEDYNFLFIVSKLQSKVTYRIMFELFPRNYLKCTNPRNIQKRQQQKSKVWLKTAIL